jgi:hypothetical protein
MRWLIGTALALSGGTALYGAFQQQRLAAQLAGLSADLRELRAMPRPAAGAMPLDARDRELLEQILSARLAQPALPAGRAAAPEQKTVARAEQPAPPQDPGPAARAAAEQASRVLDAALSRGTLRRDDVVDLRRLLEQADPPSATEIRRRIAVAINRDELVPTDPTAGFP